MKDLILKLQRLPMDSAEFKEGFNLLIDRIDSLNIEEQDLFTELATRFVNQDEERVKSR